ncbi:hypothetical protein Rsub_10064 [Raphidocelis subcapitata]|uniref:S1 motif domain-containing protein n=1 Tax=Raphidocelis subcapitata TaxID=307507 RepID=A0A2V0PH08_9CHLO|nr:hypothetical protein Rsub_10064 [Raphidocelis subcapitata]|eukprot:GBF97203.1 hypothetical protein Rsub_10064 [Raphidocelis subcapitata]
MAARGRTHLTASTSQPAAYAAASRRRAPGRRAAPGPAPPRITNTQKEVWEHDDRAREMKKGMEPNPEYIEVDTLPVYDAKRGPLEQRIRRTVVEEQQSDEISIADTAYWFHTPPDGWSVNEKVPVFEELEGQWPTPMHPEEEWPWRFAFEGLQEGMVVDGIVSDIWLYHGAQIDFVCEWDGLIPILEEQWPAVMEELLPGTQVKVKIHRVRQRGLHRWPVQLELLDDRLAPLIVRPDEWRSPCDVGWAYQQGWNIDQVSEAINGHPYRPTVFGLEPDMSLAAEARQYDYGKEEPDINAYLENPLDWELADPATQADINQAIQDSL